MLLFRLALFGADRQGARRVLCGSRVERQEIVLAEAVAVRVGFDELLSVKVPVPVTGTELPLTIAVPDRPTLAPSPPVTNASTAA